MPTFLQETLAGSTQTLPAMGTWPATAHVFEAESVYAINAALAAQRPLLVRGEPGTGKSQLARAAAHQLQRAFIAEVVHARSESQDLQWRFDAVGRLSVAQTLTGLTDTERQVKLAPVNFLSPGPLWWAFDPKSANDQYQCCQYNQRKPVGEATHGSVLLIDEIDKADADLPNGLLETLGNGQFCVPHRQDEIGLTCALPPLVIITTNEERELPSAFVRRCMVLHLALPTEQQALLEWLQTKGHAHFGAQCCAAVFAQAAELLVADREAAAKHGVTPPGQAEYLDMLRAVVAMTTDTQDDPAREQQQIDILTKVSPFALKKFSGLSGL